MRGKSSDSECDSFHYSGCWRFLLEVCSCMKRMAPQVGLEPTTLRLTAGCSAIELLRSELQLFHHSRKPLDWRHERSSSRTRGSRSLPMVGRCRFGGDAKICARAMGADPPRA